jgi:hypothetical protein
VHGLIRDNWGPFSDPVFSRGGCLRIKRVSQRSAAAQPLDLDMKNDINQPAGPEGLAHLLQKAVKAGPGWRGERADLSSDEKLALADAIRQAGREPPNHLLEPREWTDRQAKLFQAGDYPDKGASITQNDISRLAESFSEPVPILIEHSTSPLELGWLTDVKADGENLMGTISLTKEADQLVRQSKAKGLSLGLSRSLDEIREVSLVEKPRIKDAQIFRSDQIVIFAEFSEGQIDWRAEYESLANERLADRAAETIERLISERRLLPAQKPEAEALLTVSPSFAEGRDIPSLVTSLLEKSPAHQLFDDTAGGSLQTPPNTIDPEAAKFYERHFPDLSLGEIAKRQKPRI